MEFKIIAAITENNCLGNNNELLYKLSDDLKRFKLITEGNIVIMGYNTYKSIGKPLPNRINIILSTNTELVLNNCIVINSIKELIEYCKNYPNLEKYIIGGGQIYSLLLPYTTQLILTKINKIIDGDTYFPDINNSDWETTYQSEIINESDVEYYYQTLNKKLNE